MRFCLWSSVLVYAVVLQTCSAHPQKELALKPWDREPSCEELRAMWRFSKRQSRATEITNEIPTYRDPFAYNMWEPYARTRSGGGGMLKNGNINARGRHVYGRIVHAVPHARPRDHPTERVRAFEEVARLLVAGPEGPAAPRRKVTAFRLSGGGVPPYEPLPLASPQLGSFQQLKQMIRSERARELQEQRLAEEASARAAALRDDAAHTYYDRILQDADAGRYAVATRSKPADGDYLSPSDYLYNYRVHPDMLSI